MRPGVLHSSITREHTKSYVVVPKGSYQAAANVKGKGEFQVMNVLRPNLPTLGVIVIRF